VHQLEMSPARGVAWRGVTLSTSLHSIIRNVRFADVAEASPSYCQAILPSGLSSSGEDQFC